MSLITTSISLQPQMPPACSFKAVSCISSLLLISPQHLPSSPKSASLLPSNPTLCSKTHDSVLHSWKLSAVSVNSDSVAVPDPEHNPDSQSKNKKSSTSPKKTTMPRKESQNSEKVFPGIIPRKPRRGRKSEAAAVEDFVRDSLGKTLASIREQNPDICIDDEEILRKRANDDANSDISDDEDNGQKAQEMVVEEDNSNWPLDADVGWGIRASEYFENHPIKNVVGEDGTQIDWEGELDDNWVQEINCLEWETFAFHPSPMMVLVFERYNRATDNWKVLKEIEKALKVYWNAKNRLPPRAVKLDINIERDLAYALKVRECPQILFLRGHKILYREKEFRNADELVQMIAYFYYKAKKPLWIDDAALTH